MTPDELCEVARATWTKLGSGGYNEAFVSNDELSIGGVTQRWVKKVCRHPYDAKSDSHRAVGKFRTITGLPAYVLTDNEWILPYIGGALVSDKQIAKAVIQAYLDTRNVIIDACGDGNFRSIGSRAVCVDVDLARRRGSVISDDPAYWNWQHLNFYLRNYTLSEPALNGYRGTPLTIFVVNSLLWLETCLSPEQIENRYITYEFIGRLGFFYILKYKLNREEIDLLFNMPEGNFNQLIWTLADLKKKLGHLPLNNAFSKIMKNPLSLLAQLFHIMRPLNWIPVFSYEHYNEAVSRRELEINGRRRTWVKIENNVRHDPIYNSSRLVHKWKNIHPKDRAYGLTGSIWFRPYWGDEPASDLATADAVLEIYKRTGYLVLNACDPGVFVMHEGQAKCVEVAYARKLDSFDNAISALLDWERIDQQLELRKRAPFDPRPHSCSIIRTILYIEHYLYSKGHVKADYLTLKSLLRARILRIERIRLSVSLMDTISNIPDVTFLQLINKFKCLTKKLNDHETNVLLELQELDPLGEINAHLQSFIEAGRRDAPAHKLIHLAAEHCLLNVIRALVGRNRELLGMKDPDSNKTLLHVAILSTCEGKPKQDLVEYLIGLGVNLNEQMAHQPDNPFSRFTALDCAERLDLAEIRHMLRDVAGALRSSELPFQEALPVEAEIQRPILPAVVSSEGDGRPICPAAPTQQLMGQMPSPNAVTAPMGIEFTVQDMPVINHQVGGTNDDAITQQFPIPATRDTERAVRVERRTALAANHLSFFGRTLQSMVRATCGDACAERCCGPLNAI